jgi:hypothetical protein
MDAEELRFQETGFQKPRDRTSKARTAAQAGFVIMKEQNQLFWLWQMKLQ